MAFGRGRRLEGLGVVSRCDDANPGTPSAGSAIGAAVERSVVVILMTRTSAVLWSIRAGSPCKEDDCLHIRISFNSPWDLTKGLG